MRRRRSGGGCEIYRSDSGRGLGIEGLLSEEDGYLVTTGDAGGGWWKIGSI